MRGKVRSPVEGGLAEKQDDRLLNSVDSVSLWREIKGLGTRFRTKYRYQRISSLPLFILPAVRN